MVHTFNFCKKHKTFLPQNFCLCGIPHNSDLASYNYGYNLATLMRPGRLFQNALLGIMSTPEALYWTLIIIIPVTRYTTTPIMSL